MSKFEELEKKIGYHFEDADLLRTSMTHSSYANEHAAQGPANNERLEFVGDSLLDMTISLLLYSHTPAMSEGAMTKLRAGLVCEKTLSRLASELGLGSYLLLGKGEELGGGRNRPSILADAVEALIAAIYLDGGFEPVMRFTEHRFLPLLKSAAKESTDYKTLLQEHVQNTPGLTHSYKHTGESGPDHDKLFTAQVLINGKVSGIGTGRTKKSAQQAAAEDALNKMRG